MTRDEAAAEAAATKVWPVKNHPKYKKIYSLQWAVYREAFLAGIEHERKRSQVLVDALKFYAENNTHVFKTPEEGGDPMDIDNGDIARKALEE